MTTQAVGRIRWPLLAGMISILAVAAAANPTNSAWSLRVWASDDGLPNNNVTSLAQAPDGYLWIATPGKLARFDGMQFEIFSQRSIVPQFNRKITTVLQARDGSLWLGMERGPVLCLKGGKVQIITNDVPDMVAKTMVEDADGAVWALFYGGSGEILCRIRDGKASPVQTTGRLRALGRDNRGRVWLMNDGRISVFELGQFKVMAQVPNQTACLAAANDGGIWICSGLVLFKYNETNGLKRIGTCNSQTDNARPMALLEDHTGAVWLGTSDSGLFRFVAGQAESVPASHLEILSLLEDREGNLWAGTGGGGLDRIQSRAIELEGTEKGLPFEAVLSLCEDTHGAIWAATQNGLLACRQNGAWSTVTTNTGWPGGKVNCVAAARDGTVWFGTQNRELISWQDGHFKIWNAGDGIISRQVHSLLVARNGDVWIGGNVPDGLQRLRAGRLQGFPLPPDVHVIRAMAEDAAGNIWVGTANGTLLKISGDQVADESVQLSGTQWSIRSLYVSSDDSLWIGYSGWGLARFKDGHYRRVTSEQGLFDDQISQVISDGGGWLWLGADHGIFKIRQQEFDDVATGRTAHLHSIPYGPSDSLPNLQANFGSAPGALRSQDGRLWIPMRTALAVVRPDQLREDREPPSVLLTRVVMDDRTIAVYGGASPMQNVADLRDRQMTFRFPPAYHRLEFDFTALSYTAPESVSFQYRLDGLDDKWIKGESQRSVSFSRLPAGNYRFQVRACNRDGVWNETGAALPFTVEPFLWKTWWFQLAVLVGFTSTVFIVARYVSFHRLRFQLQMVERQAVLDKERTRIARDIHDDLGCRLTKIILLTELSLRNAGKADNATERVKQISTTAREGMQSLDATVWAINPRNDTLPYLIDYIGQFAVEFLQAADIRCHLDLPDHPPARAISAEVRHNLFLAVKEALNNIVRHSGAREVHLRVATDEEELSITIKDDGRGFGQMPDNAGADGLRNMKQRLEEIRGRSRIESAPGQGTKISFIHSWRNGS